MLMQMSDITRLNVTPDLAQEILDSSLPGWQRTIKPGKLAQYVKDMQSGKWKPLNSMIQIAVTPSGDILLDGQHRLKAICVSGIAQMFFVSRIEMSNEEAHERYGLIDNLTARTTVDAIRAATDDMLIVGVSRENTKYLLSAIPFVMSDFGEKDFVMNPGDRFEVARQWANEFSSVRELFVTDMWEKFRAAPYMAGAIYIIKYQPEMASEFIRQVALGDVKNVYSPSRRLREFILINSAKSGMSNGARDSRLTRLRAFSRCWNAHYLGQSIQKLYMPSRVSFMGTPLE